MDELKGEVVSFKHYEVSTSLSVLIDLCFKDEAGFLADKVDENPLLAALGLMKVEVRLISGFVAAN